jgi:Flp pilus assembly protein TadG
MTHRRRNHISLRTEDGQTAVEFALIAPVLLALLLGILQAGIAFHQYISITDAARAAARQAIVARVSDVTEADVRQAAKDAAGSLDQTKIDVSWSNPDDPTFTHAGSEVTVTVKYPYSINVLGWVVASGNLTSTMKGRLE